MNQDESLLAHIPDFLSIEGMFKARPSEEKGERFIYLEASREARDQQDEIVLAKALEDSAETFLRYGNIDINHMSMPSVAKAHGITQPELWEIGVPDEVVVKGASTFVKARLYKGDTPMAERANQVWESMTQLNPPRRWYPSVGGAVLAKSVQTDPKTGQKIGVVSKVRWTNIGISQQPVNQHVSGIATVPFGALAKSWTPNGFAFLKSLDAGYGTDSATLTGGSALRVQSMGGIPQSYFDFRDRLSAAVRGRDAKIQTSAGLIAYSTKQFGLSGDEATEWVNRFLCDLKNRLTKRGS
jgi:hypothetical protein